MSMEYEKSYIHRPEMCPVLGTQDVMVGIPVEVKPFAEVGKIKTECVGRPIIVRGSSMCEGKPKDTCRFTISQKMRVEVPVAFGARTQVGQARVDCKCSHHESGIEPCDAGKCGESEHTCHGLIG